MTLTLTPLLWIVVAVALPLFGVAAVVAVVKIIRGPGILDRMIGTDVLLGVLLCGIGCFIVFTGHWDLLIVMMCIAAFSFIGTVSVSRYVSRGATLNEYPLPPVAPAQPPATAAGPAATDQEEAR